MVFLRVSLVLQESMVWTPWVSAGDLEGTNMSSEGVDGQLWGEQPEARHLWTALG